MRKNALSNQILALDVARGVLSKNKVLDDLCINDDDFKNYIRGARKKIQRLEEAAEYRRLLLEND